MLKRAAPVHEAPALRGVRRRVGPLGVFVCSLSLQFLQKAVSTTWTRDLLVTRRQLLPLRHDWILMLTLQYFKIQTQYEDMTNCSCTNPWCFKHMLLGLEWCQVGSHLYPISSLEQILRSFVTLRLGLLVHLRISCSPFEQKYVREIFKGIRSGIPLATLDYTKQESWLVCQQCTYYKTAKIEMHIDDYNI
jgi:hypothetical protein